MKRLYLMITITNRVASRRFVEFYQRFGASQILSALGRGTASDDTLSMLGLEATEKAALFSIVTPEKRDFLFDRLLDTMQITTPGNGIALSLPLSLSLIHIYPLKDSAMNHYARLYSSSHSEPLYIKEHTAQLAKDQQTRYQEAFVQKKINALSCSTTFEMGVDVGSLETVYMRDVPPSPSNYVQRAGRAGRAKHSAAFVMT